MKRLKSRGPIISDDGRNPCRLTAMKPATIILVCALLVGGLEVYLGQNARTFGNGTLQDHMSVYDADNNQVISVEELQALQADQERIRQRLRNRWDLDHDGRISIVEREAAREQVRVMIRQRRLMRFEGEDADGNDLLSEEEFFGISAVAAATTTNPTLASELFNHLDEDGDGFISKPEFLLGLDRTRAPDDGITPKPVPERHPDLSDGRR